MCFELKEQGAPSAGPGSVQYSYGTTSVSQRFPLDGSGLAYKGLPVGLPDGKKDACYTVMILTPGLDSPVCSLYGGYVSCSDHL